MSDDLVYDVEADLEAAIVVMRSCAADYASSNPALCNRLYAAADQWAADLQKLRLSRMQAGDTAKTDPLL